MVGELGVEAQVLNHLQTSAGMERFDSHHIQACLCPLKAEENVCQWARSRGVPLVVVGKEEPPGENFVSVDYHACCGELTQVLIADGLSRVAFVGELSFINHRKARDGYLEAVKPLGYGQRLTRDVNERIAADAFIELLDDDMAVDAIVAMGKDLPFKALSMIAKLKKKVRLACLRESYEIDQLKDVAYIAMYSQLDAGRLAMDLLRDIYSGRVSSPKTVYAPFEINHPIQRLNL